MDLTQIIIYILIAVFGTLLTALCGAIAWYLKSLKGDLKEFKDDQENKLCKLGDKIHDLEIRISDKYVLKEDFVRNLAALENKMEEGLKRILDTLKEYFKKAGDEGEKPNGL